MITAHTQPTRVNPAPTQNAVLPILPHAFDAANKFLFLSEFISVYFFLIVKNKEGPENPTPLANNVQKSPIRFYYDFSQ